MSNFNFKKLVFMSIICVFSLVFQAGGSINVFTEQNISRSENIPIYGTFELIIKVPGVSGNKFRKFASVAFYKNDRTFEIDGFYDGGDTWCARFMPDEPGEWKFRWSFGGSSGTGVFTCVSERVDPDAHGHVHVDNKHRRYLVCDDGTPFYSFGGKWFNGPNYAPIAKKGQLKGGRYGRYSDDQIISYLDTCKKYCHNSSLMKISYFPLENDKLSWDLDWIHRAEWLVKEMRKRGIYCQINFFCTWGRHKDFDFKYSNKGEQQVLNIWKDEDDEQKRNYIRTIVARFAGFYNVYWELGNEIISFEKTPGDPFIFRNQANKKYIPWIKRFDPYGLPIGCSFWNYDIAYNSFKTDIHFVHDNNEQIDLCRPFDRPIIQNETCNGPGKANWRDSDIRDLKAAKYYRSTFWGMFIRGMAGSYGASWLDIAKPLNQAVIDVMTYQMHLRNFIESLPVSINEMYPDDTFLISALPGFRVRSKPGICYVAYKEWTETDQKKGKMTIRFPSGSYNLKWYNPATGKYFRSSDITSKGGNYEIIHPPLKKYTCYVLCVSIKST